MNANTVTFGTLKGLDQSMNPQLMKYGRETDLSIAQARREHRRRLFGCFVHPSKSVVEHSEPYRYVYGSITAPYGLNDSAARIELVINH